MMSGVSLRLLDLQSAECKHCRKMHYNRILSDDLENVEYLFVIDLLDFFVMKINQD